VDSSKLEQYNPVKLAMFVMLVQPRDVGDVGDVSDISAFSDVSDLLECDTCNFVKQSSSLICFERQIKLFDLNKYLKSSSLNF